MTTKFNPQLNAEFQKLFNTLLKKAKLDARNRAYVPTSVYDAENQAVSVFKEQGLIADYHKHSDGRQRFELTEEAMELTLMGDGSTF